MRFITRWLVAIILVSPVLAQETTTPNGIVDNRRDALALTGATVYLPGEGYRQNATVLIREGRVVDVIAGNDRDRAGHGDQAQRRNSGC